MKKCRRLVQTFDKAVTKFPSRQDTVLVYVWFVCLAVRK